MIAIMHSIYSQSVHAPALDAGLMDNDAERYCKWGGGGGGTIDNDISTFITMNNME